MQKPFLLLVFVLIFSFSLLVEAKVPDEISSEEAASQSAQQIFREISQVLKEKGYKGKYGLKLALIKPDFTLEKGKILLIVPVKDDTGTTLQSTSDLMKNIYDRMFSMFQETELFANVLSQDPKTTADYRLEVYLRFVKGETCLWGLNLYDNKTNTLLVSGFDRSSTTGANFASVLFIGYPTYPRPLDFFITEIPKKIILFVGRNNPEFNTEYLVRLNRKFR